MIDGVVNILKSEGMTSHDVVNKVRKIFHTKKVGHTGTLDPDAVGVLPICIGQGTRLAEYLMDKEKVYKTILNFGRETDTQDISGQTTKETALPFLSREEFSQILASFVGEIEQIPPMYSAIKKDGQPLYQLARKGISVEVAPRKVIVKDIQLLMYTPQSAMLEIRCGKGTYIRTLCQDIGRACQSSAYMSYLLRTQSGTFKIEDSIPLEKLAQMEYPEETVIDLNEALKDMPQIIFADKKAQQELANGMKQKISTENQTGIYKALNEKQQLLAVGHLEENYFKPDKVFKAGERHEYPHNNN